MLTRRVIDGNYQPLGFQRITSLSASTALTVPDGARIAVVVCETQAVRWRDHGDPPTASVGMPLATGTYIVFDSDLVALRFIEQTAGALLNVSYYK